MHWLHTSCSAWFNVKHERVGPLFLGRYRAVPVETRRLCGRTLGQLGLEAGGMSEAAAGMMIRRFEARMEQDAAVQQQRDAVLGTLDVRP